MIERILGMLLGRAGKGAQGSILSALLPMLAGGAGGLDLGSLLGSLRGAGLGSKVDSWVGQGPNQQLSRREVRQAIDQSQLEELARRAGVSERQAADGLRRLLPSMVDGLTPDGELPDDDGLPDGLGRLRSSLGL